MYLLRSLKDGKFYIGWTTDLKRRLDEHGEGLVRSTKGRGPLVLVHFETYPTQELARTRERSLKRYPNMLVYFKKRAGCSSALAPSGARAKELVG